MVRAKSSMAVVALLTVALLASVPSAFAEDTPDPMGKSTKKVARPTKSPAARTRERMALKGVVDGKDWGISLNLTETTLSNVLHFLCEIGRAKPREVNILIDHRAIEGAGIDMEDALTLDAKGLSLDEALKMVLGKQLTYAVLDDGTVVISSPAGLKRLTTQGGPLFVGSTPAAKATQERMARKGIHDGEDWSVQLSLHDHTLSWLLKRLPEMARAKPREVVMAIDRAGIKAAGIDIEDTWLTIDGRDLSLQRALALILREPFRYAILDDGTVLVSSPARLATFQERCEPVFVGRSPLAREVHKRIARKGKHDGQDWSINLRRDHSTVGRVLDVLKEMTQAKPREIKMVIDREGIKVAEVDLEDTLNMNTRGLSFQQTLTLVLQPSLGYAILGDGTVRISSRDALRKLKAKVQPGEFFVQGEVKRQGVFSLGGGKLTLSKAIAAAGGLTDEADPTRIEIIRRTGEDTERIVTVDLDAITRGESPDIELQEDDLIRVPKKDKSR